MNPTGIGGDTVVEEVAIKASANRVFDAFANPTERLQWWSAPDGRFVTTHVESDLRVGGRWEMRGTRQDGRPFVVRGEYRSVERPTLLVFTWLPDWQGDATESFVRVEFSEANGVTHVRLTHSGRTSEPSRASHRGWAQILARLQAYVDTR